MYIVRLRIGDYHNMCETSADFASLYRAGRSLVRFGKRWQIKTSVIIVDVLTNKTIVRFYSQKSGVTREWLAAQSSVGKYNKHIYF